MAPQIERPIHITHQFIHFLKKLPTRFRRIGRNYAKTFSIIVFVCRRRRRRKYLGAWLFASVV